MNIRYPIYEGVYRILTFRYHLPQQERQTANGQTDYRTGDYRENRANQRLQKQERQNL